ncbi:alpha/beta hydrolase [uncultured Veillonella sp.]|uniref:alpha/beta hydrolase n=1 Tax=uncultured Veillonella sp. TaxID=159268 RepID=UPI0025DF2C1D|nr:alpha/beta hydrolase [uncultured Veillonella sp.]
MKRNKIWFKTVAITAFTALCLVSSSLAASFTLPSQGLILQGEPKQTYISTEMEQFFTNPSAQVSKFKGLDNWEQSVEYLNGVKVEHYSLKLGELTEGESDRVILQLHGGGYVAGMSQAHRVLAMKVGSLVKANYVYSVDYRLAPDYVYPAALEDAVGAYKGLLAKGINPNHLIVMGDSAGGNLALELSLYLKEHNLPQPGVLLLASPWADFEHKDNTSRTYNDSKDQVLGLGTPLNGAVKEPVYAGKLDLKDARLSPIYADLTGLPPMLIQTGGNELFVTENEALAAKATSDGVLVSLTVYPGMPHDFALLLPDMDDSVQSLAEMRDFVNRNLK